ncbi:hypothetical protein OH492_08720 [Vibrio chagasii]|nr:hypothetical protein [Vibrio chagasii]
MWQSRDTTLVGSDAAALEAEHGAAKLALGATIAVTGVLHP